MRASLQDVAAVVLASRGGARLERALDSVAWAGERIVLDPAGRLGTEPLPSGVRRGGDPAEAAAAPWLLLVEEHEAVGAPLAAAIAGAGDARGAPARPARPPARLGSRDPAPPGGRARTRGARPGGRVLGTLDARRAGRLSGSGRLRQALGDAAGGGRAAAVRMPASYALLRSGAVRAAIRTDLIQALAPWLLAARLELPLGTEAI